MNTFRLLLFTMLFLLGSSVAMGFSGNLTITAVDYNQFLFTLNVSAPANLTVCYGISDPVEFCFNDLNYGLSPGYLVSGNDLQNQTTYEYLVLTYDQEGNALSHTGTLQIGGIVSSPPPWPGSVQERAAEQVPEQSSTNWQVVTIISLIAAGALITAVPFPEQLKKYLIGIIGIVLLLTILSLL